MAFSSNERQAASNKAGEIAGRAIALVAACLRDEISPQQLTIICTEIQTRAQALQDQIIADTND